MSRQFRKDLVDLHMVVKDYIEYLADESATSHESKHHSLALDRAIRKVYTCPRCMAGMAEHNMRRLVGWKACDTILTEKVDSTRRELPRRTTAAMRRSGAYKLGYFDALVFAHSIGAMVDFPEQPENARIIARTLRTKNHRGEQHVRATGGTARGEDCGEARGGRSARRR